MTTIKAWPLNHSYTSNHFGWYLNAIPEYMHGSFVGRNESENIGHTERHFNSEFPTYVKDSKRNFDVDNPRRYLIAVTRMNEEGKYRTSIRINEPHYPQVLGLKVQQEYERLLKTSGNSSAKGDALAQFVIDNFDSELRKLLTDADIKAFKERHWLWRSFETAANGKTLAFGGHGRGSEGGPSYEVFIDHDAPLKWNIPERNDNLREDQGRPPRTPDGDAQYDALIAQIREAMAPVNTLCWIGNTKGELFYTQPIDIDLSQWVDIQQTQEKAAPMVAAKTPASAPAAAPIPKSAPAPTPLSAETVMAYPANLGAYTHHYLSGGTFLRAIPEYWTKDFSAKAQNSPRDVEFKDVDKLLEKEFPTYVGERFVKLPQDDITLTTKTFKNASGKHRTVIAVREKQGIEFLGKEVEAEFNRLESQSALTNQAKGKQLGEFLFNRLSAEEKESLADFREDFVKWSGDTLSEAFNKDSPGDYKYFTAPGGRLGFQKYALYIDHDAPLEWSLEDRRDDRNQHQNPPPTSAEGDKGYLELIKQIREAVAPTNTACWIGDGTLRYTQPIPVDLSRWVKITQKKEVAQGAAPIVLEAPPTPELVIPPFPPQAPPEPVLEEPASQTVAEPESGQTTSKATTAEKTRFSFAKVIENNLGVVATVLTAVGLGFLLTSKEKPEEGKELETPAKRTGWKIVAGGLACAAAIVAGYFKWRSYVADRPVTAASNLRLT